MPRRAVVRQTLLGLATVLVVVFIELHVVRVSYRFVVMSYELYQDREEEWIAARAAQFRICVGHVIPY
jgi:hypothetical protein